MLALPPALLDILQLKVGAEVGVVIADGKLVIEAAARQAYTIEELLEGWPAAGPNEREWMDAPPVGRELI